ASRRACRLPPRACKAARRCAWRAVPGSAPGRRAGTARGCASRHSDFDRRRTAPLEGAQSVAEHAVLLDLLVVGLESAPVPPQPLIRLTLADRPCQSVLQHPRQVQSEALRPVEQLLV